MKNIQTLHSHSVNSDGELDYQEILKTCEGNGISVVAFTDHDSVISDKYLKKLRDYAGPTKWISGIEISSGLPKELGGGATSSLHIVGLFVDPGNKKLREHCRLAKKARISRMQKMVKNLVGLGFDISEEDCLRASGGESVGRPHIVKALYSKESNSNVIEALKQRMHDAARDSRELKDKYNKLVEDETQVPYILFLDSKSYIPGIYVDYEYFVDFDSSVELIRNAGGVAILAHYFTIYKKLSEDLLECMFKVNRLDGAETVYGLEFFNSNDSREEFVSDTRRIVESLAEKHHKLKSGGVDAHKKQDFIDFANTPEYAKKTVGLAEKIIAASDVDIEATSSLE